MFQSYTNAITETSFRTGFPITQAVADGLQEGKIYCFGENYFIIHKAGFCSLLKHTDCLNELLILFQNSELPQYFHIYDAGEELITFISNCKELFNIKVRKRIQLEYSQKKMILESQIENFSMATIDESNFNSLSSLNLDLEKRFWNGKMDFIKNANGVAVFDLNKEPVSICYAAAVAQSRAEVDVFTKETHRGRGIARLAVAGFINNCIRNNITPNWDCFEENKPSLKLAINSGFKIKKKYQFLSIYK